VQTHVSWEREGDLAYLNFGCDPQGKPNTMDRTVLAELQTCLREIKTSAPELRALIVRSLSERYFIVGANVNALKELDASTIGEWVAAGHAVFNQLEALPLPTIARLEGFTLGGGLELALCCDLLLAGPEAKFGQPEARLGLVPGWGGSMRLPRRIGLGRAKELFFTGRIVDAQQALTMGLVDFVGDKEAIDSYIDALLADIRQCAPQAVAECKSLLNRSVTISNEESLSSEAWSSEACLANAETQERVATYLQSRIKPEEKRSV